MSVTLAGVAITTATVAAILVSVDQIIEKTNDIIEHFNETIELIKEGSDGTLIEDIFSAGQKLVNAVKKLVREMLKWVEGVRSYIKDSLTVDSESADEFKNLISSSALTR